MVDFRLIKFKNLLDKAFGASKNTHNEKALAFVLGDEFTTSNVDAINQLYVVS
jgi:hypothetical protein